MIADTKTDDFMDLCTDLQVGDTLFARVPFKFFPLYEAKNWNSRFNSEVTYSKSAYDIKNTVNRGKCKRVANRKNGYDRRTGSTVGGTHGFGYPRSTSNDVNPSTASAPVSRSSSSTSSSGGSSKSSYSGYYQNPGVGNQMSFQTKSIQLSNTGMPYNPGFVVQPIRSLGQNPSPI